MANSKILTAEQERALRQPIDEYVGGIQKEIDALRKDGTTRVVECQSAIAGIKRDKTLSDCIKRIQDDDDVLSSKIISIC